MATLNLGHVRGDNGVGIPSGGTAGQVLQKGSATNYDTRWATMLANGIGLSYTISIANGGAATVATIANYSVIALRVMSNWFFVPVKLSLTYNYSVTTKYATGLHIQSGAVTVTTAGVITHTVHSRFFISDAGVVTTTTSYSAIDGVVGLC